MTTGQREPKPFAGVRASPEQIAQVRADLLAGKTTYEAGALHDRSNAWASHVGHMGGLDHNKELGWHDPVQTYEAAKAFVADPVETHGLACFTVGCSDAECPWRTGEHLAEERTRNIVLPLQDADWEDACRLLDQAATKIDDLLAERESLRLQIEQSHYADQDVSSLQQELDEVYGRYGIIEAESVELRGQLDATQKVNRHLGSDNERLTAENERLCDVIKREISRPYLRKSMDSLRASLSK